MVAYSHLYLSFWNRRSLSLLIVGFIVGVCLTQMLILSTPSRHEYLPYDKLGEEGPAADVVAHQHTNENVSISKRLNNEVRVLCWILTSPKNHKSKAIHVKRTWGRRCNKLLFMSSKLDEELGTVTLTAQEGYNHLWGKTKEAFKYIYAHHLNDADWFFKADDDTYAVMENMRYMLYPYSPETPIYFGYKFKYYGKQGYMSGGSGYVLSKEAVRRFVEKALPNKDICRENNGGFEDVEMGKCLEKVNVTAGDSRDQYARNRFFPLDVEEHMVPKDICYWTYIYYKVDENAEPLSDSAISFNNVSPNQMYVFEYFIYHLRPYGINNTLESLPERLKVGQTLPPPVAQSLAIEMNSTTQKL